MIIVSNDNAENLVVRIRIMNTSQTSDEERAEQCDHLKNIEQALLDDLPLKGIPEIKKVLMRNAQRKFIDSATGAYKSDLPEKGEWVLETDGSNLAAVLNVQEVDPTRTITNHIPQIVHSLGIEAVRQALLNEIRVVLGAYGIYVNYRHLAVLCDVMTQRGQLMAITRNGINRINQGPLRKASFEETVEQLLQAAIFAEIDLVAGVTENVMLGQLAPIGTACFDLLLKQDAIQQPKW